MQTNGERANWQGQRFSESCEELVKKLNYEEKMTRTSGKDMIALPNNDETLGLKPYFSPAGITSFEFTTKGGSATDDIDNFSKKVKGDISGCVLIRNIKISEKELEYGKTKKIFCWDNRTTSFLASKLFFFHTWSRHGTTLEKKVSNDVTYIRCLEEKSKPFQIRLAILFHDPLKEIGADDVKEALDIVKGDLSGSGILPCLINCIVLTRSLPRKDLYNQFDSLLGKKSKETKDKMVFTSIKKPIIDFYTSPFYFEISLSESPDIFL